MSEPIPAPASEPLAPAQARTTVPTPSRGAIARLSNLGWGVMASSPLILAGVFLKPAAEGMGTHRQLGLPPCTFLFLTGFPCPFCGMTTSWTHAMHGDILSSIAVQPMGFVLVAMDFAIAVWLLGRFAVGSPSFRPEQWLARVPPRVFYACFAGTGLAWIYKALLVRGWL